MEPTPPIDQDPPPPAPPGLADRILYAHTWLIQRREAWAGPASGWDTETVNGHHVVLGMFVDFLTDEAAQRRATPAERAARDFLEILDKNSLPGGESDTRESEWPLKITIRDDPELTDRFCAALNQLQRELGKLNYG